MLQDKDAIIKKLGEKSKFESNGKGNTELSKINRCLGVNFENNADKERVFAEVAKYIVDLRNVVVSYIK